MSGKVGAFTVMFMGKNIYLGKVSLVIQLDTGGYLKSGKTKILKGRNMTLTREKVVTFQRIDRLFSSFPGSRLRAHGLHFVI